MEHAYIYELRRVKQSAYWKSTEIYLICYFLFSSFVKMFRNFEAAHCSIASAVKLYKFQIALNI